MSFRWTETLIPELAEPTRVGRWARIDRHRGGAWHVRAHGSPRDRWHRIDRGTLEPVRMRDDEALPHLTELLDRWNREGGAVSVLSWRVGRRAVICLNGAGVPRVYKLYRRDRRVLDRWTSLPAREWRVPQILDWDAERHVLTLEPCPGDPLDRRLRRGDGGPADGERLADLLAWIGAAEVPVGFPSHGVAEEIRVLDDQWTLYESVLAEPAPTARELTVRVAAELTGQPSARPVICHRDLHDGQILVEGDAGQLIDMDLAAAGPPGLDPGNLLAHLRLRSLQGHPVAWRTIARPLAARAIADRGISESLAVWTAASLVRLGLVYARRARTARLIDELLGSAEQALERAGEWDGLL